MNCIIKGCTRQATGNGIRSTNTGMCGAHRKRKSQGKPVNVALRQRVLHGLSKTSPLYKTWQGMRERCNSPRAAHYADYGGRGIKVCDRWNDFSLFMADMGDKPCGTTLERINNDKGYEPNNVRWATHREQLFNQRISRRNKSGYRNIYWEERRKKWLVNIAVNRKTIFIGRYTNLADAIEAQKGAIKEYGY